MYSRNDEISRIKPVRKKETKKQIRAKGYGTIEKRKDRKNPYRVKVPIGVFSDKEGRKQTKYKTIGTFATKKQAEDALANFNKKPYDLGSSIKTFADLYHAWSSEYFKGLTNASSIRSIRATYAYLHEYYDMPIQSASVGVIKDMMANAYIIVGNGSREGVMKTASKNTQERIKSLCNLMFDYALEHSLVSENPARKFKVTKLIQEIDEQKKVKKPFTSDQIQNMWAHLESIEYMDMVLIQIYTGLRPRELCTIYTADVHIEEGYMTGGMKTEAGRNRIIPIHPDIAELVKSRYLVALENYKSEYLFCRSVKEEIVPITYDAYRRIFIKVMEQLGMEGYSPHCARHTFATFAELSGLRDLAIKQIMGHSYDKDVTNKYYKHTNIEYLRDEMRKLRFGGGTDG